MKKLLSVIGLLSLLTFSFPALATSYPVGGFQYYLAGAGTNTSATNIQLTSFKTPDGRPITMSMFGATGYGAIDPQTNSKIEDVTFTGVTQNGNGTAMLTGVTRGIDFVFPYAASTTLTRSHTGGSTFILTNTPSYYYDEFAMVNNNNVVATPTVPFSIANKAYVDSVAFSGAGVINASTANKGIVQIATGQQAASSTLNGSTGAQLVLPSSIASSTWNASTTIGVIPVTGSNGKIDSNFIATSTLFGVPVVNTYTSDLVTATWTKKPGLKYVVVKVQAAGGGSGNYIFTNGGVRGATAGGGAGGYGESLIAATSLPSSVSVAIGSSTVANNGGGSSFGTFIVTTGGATSVSGSDIGYSGSLGAGGTSTGADLNIAGQSGGPAYNTDASSALTGISGTGGSSQLGRGGQFRAGGSATGNTGFGYGAGAGGTINNTNSSTQAGQYGQPGIVTVTEYYD